MGRATHHEGGGPLHEGGLMHGGVDHGVPDLGGVGVGGGGVDVHGQAGEHLPRLHGFTCLKNYAFTWVIWMFYVSVGGSVGGVLELQC